MRALILASPFDAIADAVTGRIAGGGGVVERRSLEDLGAARWEHRLGAEGVSTTLAFVDDARSASIAPDIVFNRLRYEPTLLFTRMAVADRDYARAEFQALLLSWLASLGRRLVGQPAPSGLAGVQQGAWQWLAAAAEAGFVPYPAAAMTGSRRAAPPTGWPTWPALLPGVDDPALDRLGTNRPRAVAPVAIAHATLFVVGDGVFGVDEPALADAGRRLAAALDADILGIDLARTTEDDGWRFVTATTLPDDLPAPALDALLALLEARS